MVRNLERAMCCDAESWIGFGIWSSFQESRKNQKQANELAPHPWLLLKFVKL